MLVDSYAASRSDTGSVVDRRGGEGGWDGVQTYPDLSAQFDGLLEALRRARHALQRSDIVAKSEAIGLAIHIVDDGLKARLSNPAAGELAGDMYALYIYISRCLAQADLSNDDLALEECQHLIHPLRNAWAAAQPAVGHA